MLYVLESIRAGHLGLISSEMLIYEIRQNPHWERQQFALEAIMQAETYVILSESVQRRAGNLNAKGIAPADSLHLACAEEANADYFCTCDDSFLSKAKREANRNIKPLNPLEFAGELEQWKNQRNH